MTRRSLLPKPHQPSYYLEKWEHIRLEIARKCAFGKAHMLLVLAVACCIQWGVSRGYLPSRVSPIAYGGATPLVCTYVCTGSLFVYFAAVRRLIPSWTLVHLSLLLLYPLAILCFPGIAVTDEHTYVPHDTIFEGRGNVQKQPVIITAVTACGSNQHHLFLGGMIS